MDSIGDGVLPCKLCFLGPALPVANAAAVYIVSPWPSQWAGLRRAAGDDVAGEVGARQLGVEVRAEGGALEVVLDRQAPARTPSVFLAAYHMPALAVK